jgi:multisubunit Na+/H+ antiporter MnhG subunit
VRTVTDAFLAAIAVIRMIDTGMAMHENTDFSKDVGGAGFHTLPTGLASVSVELDKFRACVFPLFPTVGMKLHVH